MGAIILRQSGAVTDLFANLHAQSIQQFTTVDEILDFGRNYQNKIQEIKRQKQIEIQQDIKTLTLEIQELDNTYNNRKDY